MRAAVWIIQAVCLTAGAWRCGNVALRGRAIQSSTGYGGVADRAIDGNKNPYYHNLSCTHTNAELQPWWSVDLFTVERVFLVKITNRGDCCWDRLKNAKVIVGDSVGRRAEGKVCGVISSLGCGETAVLLCHDTPGRIVTVVLGGYGILTLCEVEVYVRE
ncbi:fucolectin-4-like isoform X1 [Mobula birostris]|uniref:fucolectin-4-like isoform X1 n=1 Tax=Mobula birostris TaxID=1983395 RepID=UPI003B28510F